MSPSRYSHRGLAPHKFAPMLGAHTAVQRTFFNWPCAAAYIVSAAHGQLKIAVDLDVRRRNSIMVAQLSKKQCITLDSIHHAVFVSDSS